MYFYLIIIGSGPGGDVAEIRAAQLGLKTAIVEKANLGGVNWGCITTKSLLKSANIFNSFKQASQYGIIINNIKFDFKKIIYIIEKMSNILPSSDLEIYIHLKKNCVIIKTSSIIKDFIYLNDKQCTKVIINNSKNETEILYVDVIISAIGICPNPENLGLENLVIKQNNTKHICVDKYYSTNVKGYSAIGDVIPSISLAHVASYEGIICVEKITGLNPSPLNYNNVPMWIYTNPEISYVGYSEKEALKKGLIKIIFDKKYGELLVCHMIGNGVTELIYEIVVARQLETTLFEFFKCIHPHPTISESIIEAINNADKKCIHI
ncbi:FAD-dependent oxidoreductase [Candidatus Karelsulcia muelleri]|uniref:FAD-dependent oxidoreductase n=1 Tax=Candidatus Karelsulcia muelleri TaxID=336810 RepID=UPI000D7C513E|nr:FAD-dependent oxidoreductase [Candidatus Karelsulcia muelleri]